jgi:hypothetical protein
MKREFKIIEAQFPNGIENLLNNEFSDWRIINVIYNNGFMAAIERRVKK